MKAIALTDHGNMFGAVEFYSAVNKVGLKPILGLEAYISPTTRGDRSMGKIETAAYHLVLLAMNRTGWTNLMKLSSRAYLEGFYYRPRVDLELLSQFNEGLICTTACLKGQLASALLAHQPKIARKIGGDYLDIFGKDRLFIEVQNQGIAEQDRVNPMLVDLAASWAWGWSAPTTCISCAAGQPGGPPGPHLHRHAEDPQRPRQAGIPARTVSQGRRRHAGGAGGVPRGG